MKSTFLLGFVLAFAGVLTGAYVYPLGAPARVNSITTVALNGGRQETFVIRLPADRIASIGDATSGIRGTSDPLSVELPEPLAASGVLIEHFKVRDVEGAVIGLASRHWTFAPTGPVTVWAIDIPGRGAIVFSGPGEFPINLDAALGAQGYLPGESWNGEAGVEMIQDASRTRVVAGSEEFRNAQGSYEEAWELTGVDESGELRGTIELRTRVNKPS